MRFGSTQALADGIKPVAEWLIKNQTAAGGWGTVGEGDQQRSHRAVSILQLHYENTADDATLEAIVRYVRWVLGGGEPTLCEQVLATGFIGLVFSDLLSPWATFGPPPPAL